MLVAIDSHPIRTPKDITSRIVAAGVGSTVRYQLVRAGAPLELGVVLASEPRPVTVKTYLQVVGVFYLLLGLFVLWRRLRAARATHFAISVAASNASDSPEMSFRLSAHISRPKQR